MQILYREYSAARVRLQMYAVAERDREETYRTWLPSSASEPHGRGVRLQQVPPVIAAEYLMVLDEAVSARLRRREVVTRLDIRLLIFLEYEKAVF